MEQLDAERIPLHFIFHLWLIFSDQIAIALPTKFELSG